VKELDVCSERLPGDTEDDMQIRSYASTADYKPPGGKHVPNEPDPDQLYRSPNPKTSPHPDRYLAGFRDADGDPWGVAPLEAEQVRRVLGMDRRHWRVAMHKIDVELVRTARPCSPAGTART
jgi:hypothetical protein